MKREGELKSAFTHELKARLPHFIVQYFSSAGSPDRSITGNGVTSHWEFKHATPNFVSQGDQELMCLRLAVAGHCRYVIWWESRTGVGKRTMIVHPRVVYEHQPLLSETWTIGFDHRWLCEQIMKAHGL